ncbi:hypothetical protein [Nocardioides sp.]|uniref:hypothetical protein n=1 Tax=Nocardioides sp. TaxID=35761 RepID=UPI0026172CE1|nr:hypothetical protein [Nocardioides sp.]
MTDDKSVSFAYSTANNETPSATLKNTTTWARDLIDATSWSTSLSSSVASTTDVVMHDAPYTDWCEAALDANWTTNGITGMGGVTTCATITPGNRCQQAHVRISTLYFNAHTVTPRRWITCHEIGHALGLAHRALTAGCMDDCVDSSTPAYSAHDLAHLAAALTQSATAGTICPS